MRKLLLLSVTALAVLAFAAAPAMATHANGTDGNGESTDLGPTVGNVLNTTEDPGPPVGPTGLNWNNSDWDGHDDAGVATGESRHCNNVASPNYYDPRSDQNVAKTGSASGNSWYVVVPDPVDDAGKMAHANLTYDGDGDVCGATPAPVLVATGYFQQGPYTGAGTVQNPSCDPDPPNAQHPDRNPCNGTDAFYVGVPVPTGVQADGRVDVGQSGTLPNPTV